MRGSWCRCSHKVLAGKAGVGWETCASTRLHFGAWEKPAKTHVELLQGLLWAPLALPAARVARGPCRPLNTCQQDVVLLEMPSVWVRLGHESIPRAAAWCRPAPSEGCAAGHSHRLPVCNAFLSPLPPSRHRSGR